METTKVLDMIFVASDGSKVTVSVPSPRDGLASEEIGTAMDSIITADVFTDNHGSFVEKAGARTVTKTTEEIELA